MEPYFISTQLDKFQMCICPGCSGDATSQVSAKMEDGTNYYLAACYRKSHRKQSKEAKEALEEGQKPESLHVSKALNVDELFIQPPGRDQKCKIQQWIAFKADPVAPVPVPQPPAAAQAQRQNTEKVYPVSKNWEWEHRMGWWKRADGRRVRIERLPLNELICTVQAIQEQNFVRITKKLAWIRMLVRQKINYTYPEEALEVGYAEAGLKLEEFKDEAEARGLL